MKNFIRVAVIATFFLGTMHSTMQAKTFHLKTGLFFVADQQETGRFTVILQRLQKTLKSTKFLNTVKNHVNKNSNYINKVTLASSAQFIELTDDGIMHDAAEINRHAKQCINRGIIPIYFTWNEYTRNVLGLVSHAFRPRRKARPLNRAHQDKPRAPQHYFDMENDESESDEEALNKAMEDISTSLENVTLEEPNNTDIYEKTYRHLLELNSSRVKRLPANPHIRPLIIDLQLSIENNPFFKKKIKVGQEVYFDKDFPSQAVTVNDTDVAKAEEGDTNGCQCKCLSICWNKSKQFLASPEVKATIGATVKAGGSFLAKFLGEMALGALENAI